VNAESLIDILVFFVSKSFFNVCVPIQEVGISPDDKLWDQRWNLVSKLKHESLEKQSE